MTPHANADIIDHDDPQSAPLQAAPSTSARAQGLPAPSLLAQSRARTTQPPTAPSSSSTKPSTVPGRPSATTTTTTTSSTSSKATVVPSKKKAIAGRTIHNVVLGDQMFETWYGSLYPDQLLSDDAGPGVAAGVGGRRELERLFVCPSCFRYGREVLGYIGHLRVCTLKGRRPPGRLVYEKDPYSIYEVDGEEEKLFCQNLSLFAKLFLENKSVCFDLSAFNYYILVQHSSQDRVAQHHHYGSAQSAAAHNKSAIAAPGSALGTVRQDTYQVVGFFSKEKMSWDNNNLACILVFPPWQRKGLGKILMGVSYELSRREGRVGGPEKPLSKLGKRGYLSFWSATIARYILSCPAKQAITVRRISEATFILPSDIIAALKDMDVLSPAPSSSSTPSSTMNNMSHNQQQLQQQQGQGQGQQSEESTLAMVVNKARVRDWAKLNKVDATPVVSADDFAPGWDPRVRIGEGEEGDEDSEEEEEDEDEDE